MDGLSSVDVLADVLIDVLFVEFKFLFVDCHLYTYIYIYYFQNF